MSVNNVNSSFEPGEIKFSEEKKAIDIFTAVNSLYIPHYFVRPYKVGDKVMEEHYLVFSQNAKGSNFNKAIFIPLNNEILYCRPENPAVHIANGMKIQESLGIRGKEYKEATVCMVADKYISSIQKKSLRTKALELWEGNFETLKDVSNKHPEFKGLATAVDVLSRSKNKTSSVQMDK